MIIEKLYNCCLVRRPYEFYHLKYKKEHLKKIENFKSKKIENILNSIEKSRHQKLSNFVSAFSIPLLSFIKAKKLTSLFKEKSDLLLKFVKKGDFGDIEKELGIKTTSSIKSFFLNLENLENFEKAIKEMTFIND